MDDDLRRKLLAAETLWADRRWATETHKFHSAYDVFVGNYRRVGTPITPTLLREVIPSRVKAWALERARLLDTSDINAIIRAHLSSRIAFWKRQGLVPEPEDGGLSSI